MINVISYSLSFRFTQRKLKSNKFDFSQTRLEFVSEECLAINYHSRYLNYIYLVNP